MIRALVLDTYSDSEKKIDAAIKDTVWEAATAIRKLLTPIGAGEGVARDLEALFEDAADVWRNMAQYSFKLVEALPLDDLANHLGLHLMNSTSPSFPLLLLPLLLQPFPPPPQIAQKYAESISADTCPRSR